MGDCPSPQQCVTRLVHCLSSLRLSQGSRRTTGTSMIGGLVVETYSGGFSRRKELGGCAATISEGRPGRGVPLLPYIGRRVVCRTSPATGLDSGGRVSTRGGDRRRPLSPLQGLAVSRRAPTVECYSARRSPCQSRMTIGAQRNNSGTMNYSVTGCEFRGAH